MPVFGDALTLAGMTSATRPPAANSQMRVGMPKNAHGCEKRVTKYDATSDATPAINTAMTIRCRVMRSSGSPGCMRPMSAKRNGQTK